MRVSSLPDDPDYRPEHITSRIKILFNGEDAKAVVPGAIFVADEERGSVRFWAKAGPSHFLTEGGELVERRMNGHVQIILPGGA